MNRVVFALVAILFLLSVSSIAGLIRVVKADGGTITINADGSITPSSAPITTDDNITYTFTANIINESIVVERDSIVVDGRGYTVQGTGNGTGITLSGSNVTIKNTEITTFYNGIWLNYSSKSSISGNNITANNAYGIVLDYSLNSSISGNNIANNRAAIWLYISSNSSIYHNNFVNNTLQVFSHVSSSNVWDDGYPSGGNYWSDYNGTDLYSGQHQNVTGSDGIGDTPYVIDANNVDHYPLITQYAIPEFPSIQAPMFFMLLTLLAVIIYKKKGVKTR